MSCQPPTTVDDPSQEMGKDSPGKKQLETILIHQTAHYPDVPTPKLDRAEVSIKWQSFRWTDVVYLQRGVTSHELRNMCAKLISETYFE